MTLPTLRQALLTPGVIKAIAYAANHPGVIAEVGTDEYDQIMNLFQDHIPHELIDCNQWWLCHYWSSARTCSKCLEFFHLFQCGELTLEQRLAEAIRRNSSDHEPSCNMHNTCTFEGLKVCLTLNELAGVKP